MSEEREMLLRSLERHALNFQAKEALASGRGASLSEQRERTIDAAMARERLLSAARALGEYDAGIRTESE